MKQLPLNHLSWHNALKQGVKSVTDLMVRPGITNLDFADVETIMSSMGKAMMGTGEAEGENRAMAATDMALNNPLIDEYSLKGAKGLLINITGGKDLTLFEVDQTVQKIRAEVDPESELIFGAIKDDNMDGKIRVSIVATALDGHKNQSNTVLNMSSRLQSRGHTNSEGLFSNINVDNTISSIDGATALKLDEKFEIDDHEENILMNEKQNNIDDFTNNSFDHHKNSEIDEIPNGVSMENASYIESRANVEIKDNNNQTIPDLGAKNNEEEHTPQLFEDDIVPSESNPHNDNEHQSEKLFDRDSNRR